MKGENDFMEQNNLGYIKNVYDIRRENGLYVIVSNNKVITNDIYHPKAAVILYLYYADSAVKYARYIKNIPDWVDIYIISSNLNLIDNMRNIYTKRNIYYKQKINLGRDVSALLVATKEYIFNYEYICFAHDKKEKNEFKRNDTNAWIDNLWGNTLENEIYIENILQYMNYNKEIGMLCPMEPIDVYVENNFWGENYNNTIELAKKIGINTAGIVKEKSPISLGTVFWAKTKALEKLLAYDWKYSDFVEEPMPDDGTISHAVERILPYVAQDAGFEVGTVMSKGYALKVIAELYDNWLKTGVYLRNKMGIRKADELKEIDKKIIEIKKFCRKHKKIYVYGAGRFAADLQNLCKSCEINLDGCIITNMNYGNITVKDIPIYEFGSVDLKESGIILAVNKSSQDEIVRNLNNAGVYDIYIFRS